MITPARADYQGVPMTPAGRTAEAAQARQRAYDLSLGQAVSRTTYRRPATSATRTYRLTSVQFHLRAAPNPDPDQLRVWSWSSSYPDFREYQQRTDVFSGVAAVSAGRMNLRWEGTSELLSGAFVSGNLFSVLGVPAALGRPLQPADDQGPGAPVVGVLSHQYWRTRLGSRPDVIGKSISVNGVAVTVAGIAAEGFHGTSLSARPAIFLPLTSITQIQTGFFARPAVLEQRGLVWLTVIGRVRQDVTPGQATEQMTAHYRRSHPPANPVSEPSLPTTR
jgi:hypothetical protein